MLWLLLPGTLIALILLLFGCQRRLIYLPQRYPPDILQRLPPDVVEVDAQTSQGHQVSFYVPPQSPQEGAPERLWVVLGGNGSVALAWLDLVQTSPDQGDAFLLVDYPGYGLSEGHSTRRTIRETTVAVMSALAAHLNASPEAPADEVGILAHSIGAAAGLDYAAEHRVDRLVLVSPFTTLEEMARRVVGWPLSLGVLDRYDNRARLTELADRPSRPAVTIIHGSQDSIVPMRMGRELAKAHPDWIQFVEIPGADHNDILDVAWPEIVSAMDGASPEN